MRGVRRTAPVPALALAIASLAIAGAVVAAPAPAAPRPPRVTHALVMRYAPLLYLDSQERYGLMRVEDFLAHAKLLWNRPGRDVVLAARGHVRADRLGAACARAPHGCYRHAGALASDLTRPTGGIDSPGFVLDLDDRLYAGSSGDVPLYYDVTVKRREVDVTYWAFYGYDLPVLQVTTTSPGLTPDVLARALSHEGDWERVVVVLSRSLAPRGVRFYEHKGSTLLPWARVATQQGSHPIAYIAQGTHASYPTAGTTRICLTPSACLLDVRDQGRAVASWQTGLARVRSQPWYGFGGAWGRVGTLTETTGPLGPSRYKR
jgi:hypothetical protein